MYALLFLGVFLIFILGFYFIFNNPILERFEDSKNSTYSQKAHADIDTILDSAENQLNINELADSIFSDSCPNILIQKGSELYLYNSTKAKIPGVNPLRFDTLNDYVEFMEWQRGQGIKCPILFLQETYDTQGNKVFKARESPTNLNGGLPDFNMNGRYPDPDPGNSSRGEALLLDAGVDDYPFNHNSFPGYDPDNQYIGLNTPLDKIYNNDNNVSPNLSNKSKNEAIYKLD